MKRSDRLRKEAEETKEKIRGIVRHIRNVEDNCLYLAEKLLDRGEIELARSLVANGMIHDISKFFGIEWENLSSGNPKEDTAKLKMKLAIHHHNTTNKSHPEAWPHGIKEMPEVYLCEFICDVKSRSEEFGTDVRTWITEVATQRYGFTKDDDIYKKIMEYIDLLCPHPFNEIK